ncbi:MAG: DUF309 domain-containing protein [Acidobacteria bacterium]|nr:DUF309 domain-containing protein [Acidobacteriota bacterium]
MAHGIDGLGGMDGLPENYSNGIELFNAGRFYECHEVLEEIWLKAEGTGALNSSSRPDSGSRRTSPTDQRAIFKGAEGVFYTGEMEFRFPALDCL